LADFELWATRLPPLGVVEEGRETVATVVDRCRLGRVD
jgi:hypothetical protein